MLPSANEHTHQLNENNLSHNIRQRGLTPSLNQLRFTNANPLGATASTAVMDKSSAGSATQNDGGGNGQPAKVARANGKRMLQCPRTVPVTNLLLSPRCSMIQMKGVSNRKSFNCEGCGRVRPTSEMFTSSNCEHRYCFSCASRVMNSCLSLLNQVPRCGVADCNKVLNIAQCPLITESLLSKYQTKQSDLEYFRKDQIFLAGFIRETLSARVFPHELVGLILKGYKSVQFSVHECAACDSTGRMLADCVHCILNCTMCKGIAPSRSVCFDVLKLLCQALAKSSGPKGWKQGIMET